MGLNGPDRFGKVGASRLNSGIGRLLDENDEDAAEDCGIPTKKKSEFMIRSHGTEINDFWS